MPVVVAPEDRTEEPQRPAVDPEAVVTVEILVLMVLPERTTTEAAVEVPVVRPEDLVEWAVLVL